jgi:surfeit locus 1 family protein
VRLGIWQLDRLEQRRNFNAHVEAMRAAPTLLLPEDADENLTEMEYRKVRVSGEYDFENEVILRNQYWRDQFGYHLLTPLVLANGTAVLVDRGWVPAEGNDDPAAWGQYAVPNKAEVSGIIRLGQEKPQVGGRPDPTLAPDQDQLEIWNNVNLERLNEQMPYSLLSVYIQLDLEEGDTSPPIPFQPELELGEGSHLGYAGQWFLFASILFFGYPFYVRKREQER